MSNNFYRAFEEQHRGSRDLIRQRLEVYRPFIAPLVGIYHPASAIDLGCGRGEWLELANDAGLEANGVDLDACMLAACIERGLAVTQGDALAHLQALPDESQAMVSGFHIAEHLPFDALQTIAQQALRVLKPGGLLILETPNPENLVVGSCNFYLDPTHQHPLPPPLLSFLTEYTGFVRVRTIRLQESETLHDDAAAVSLMAVLGGASPDYAVVAQKAAPLETLELFSKAFEHPLGIELSRLAARYDQQRTDENAVQVNIRVRRLREHTDAQLEQLREHTDAQFTELRSFYETRLSAVADQRDALLASLSWRITAPLRQVLNLMPFPLHTLRNSANTILRQAIEVFRIPLSWAMRAVLYRPALSYRINQWLLRNFPALQAHLVDVARRTRVVEQFAYLGSYAGRVPLRESRPANSDAQHASLTKYYLAFSDKHKSEKMSTEELLRSIRDEIQISGK